MRCQTVLFFVMMLLATFVAAAPSVVTRASLSSSPLAVVETSSNVALGADSEKLGSENSANPESLSFTSHFFNLFKTESLSSSMSEPKPVHRRSIRRSRHP
ncbi:hypothetical protein D9758_003008 [Tetrapyrgos nigripes]|uniref:Uncharacterized protein n=1 Tax=Tetrapyrgos nigripes TaxID=182062 RepID=A0A8H5LTG5_9AGAR|nr:hypothetical protein D9758_003008 [Tetrapyrgos nigripes]